MNLRPNNPPPSAKIGDSETDRLVPETTAAAVDGAATDAFRTVDSSAGAQRSVGGAAGAEFGPYRLLAQIGEGGMGTVYQALHTKLDKIVAIKVILGGDAGKLDRVQRFEREMKSVGKIEHPNVVRALDGGVIDGKSYLAMEYLQGENLAEVVRRQGPLPFVQAAEWIVQAAAGLQHAHDLGLIHRDVKPSNLMLCGNVVKVLDLGLARMRRDAADGEPQAALAPSALAPSALGLSDATLTHHMIGTIDFMPPEQIDARREVDQRADIYALGCTFYFLLTGRSPASGESLEERLEWHRTGPPLRLPKKLPGIPPQTEAVLRKMTDRDPQNRYQQMHEAAAAINALRLPRSRRAWLIAGFAAVLALAAMVGLRLLRPEQQPTPLPATVTGPEQIELVLIGAGEFKMGSPPKGPLDPDAQATEHPQHPVRISKPFYISKREITQQQFALVMGRNPSLHNRERLNQMLAEAVPLNVPQTQFNNPSQLPQNLQRPPVVSRGAFAPMQSNAPQSADVGQEGGFSDDTNNELQVLLEKLPESTADFPVESVSWDDAVEFCKKLSERTGQTYRLPTEAEWEYACRAGSEGRFHNGPIDGLERYRNRKEGEIPYPVAVTEVNTHGLFDMHGNVREWCLDFYLPGYPSADLLVDPSGPTEGKTHVVRGGDFHFRVEDGRCASRFGIGGPSRNIGFRVLLEVDDPITGGKTKKMGESKRRQS